MRAHREAVQLAVGAMGAASAWLRGRPFIVNHLVTVRCNLACPFCHVAGPEQADYNRAHYPRSQELGTAETRRFYQQLKDAGFRLVVVLGGEPLLREDLDETLRVLQGRVWTTVFSNGYLLAERHELVRRANNLFVSLDAPDEQHDKLRDRPKSFARALAGIEAMRRHQPDVALTVNTTVTRDNVDRVPDMLELARKLGVPIAFQPPSYDGQFALGDRPEERSSTSAPDTQRVREAFARIAEAANRGQRVIGSQAFMNHVIHNRRSYPCHYPTYVLGPVLPNGDVVGCVDSSVIGNLRSQSVAEITRSAAFRRNAADGPSCPHGCRDWGIYDLSALREGSMGGGELRRYGRMFLANRRPKAALWLATRALLRSAPS